ncbi:TMV resistance protein N [Arachis hypogaea]|nr:TMV resistance protein N [Arachis hypogaea]
MASGSSFGSIPLPTRACTYHVFLSFRSEDTGKFTIHLYNTLNRKGITTYRDDNKLRKDDVISDELLKAIEQSMFAVIVFSPDYASSSQCLDELQKILECNNKLGLHIRTVYYGVEPSDVRHQRGTFEKAFKKHEERHDREKVKRWRDALTEVAAHSGWTSKNQDEAGLVKNIAQHIFEILISKLPSSMKNFVGINSRVEQVITLIGLGLNDVRFIGIWGMGGMGKTTIARAVFETIRYNFEVTCFLADVREQCEKKDITDIQKELLKQMNISSNAVHNKYDGRTIIQNSLRLKKVLLVLDDVNHEKQLKDLAGEQDWFGPGSRIIITTRDLMVLKEEVHKTYNVEGLMESEALNLFSLEAFNLPKPSEEFLELSKEVVKYSGGLPLALKVLGSYLNGRGIEVWHSAIEKIKHFSHSEIIDVLKISYDGLDDMEKDIFLDIACFFKGYQIGDVTRKLKGCGYQVEIGLDSLINKSLVTINKYDQLVMHDLVEEMGKQIVIQESPNDPSKRSRLWCYEDLNSVLAQKRGTEAIQSIVLHSSYEEHLRFEAFSKLKLSKLLILCGVEVEVEPPSDLPCLPSTLKVLHWWRCPLKTLPLAETEHEFAEIELRFSRIEELWLGKKFLGNLKYLNLSHSWYLKETPDFSGTPILETLILGDCPDLREVHPSLVLHENLVLLDLSKCISLKTFPGILYMTSLKELILKDCRSFENRPEFGECMKQLSRLCLEGTAVRELPSSLFRLPITINKRKSREPALLLNSGQHLASKRKISSSLSLDEISHH